MDYPNKDQRWVFHEKTEAQETAPGVVRRVLAYCDNVMCVENTFKKGSIGAMHNHPVSLNLPLTEKYIQSVKGIRC